MSHWIRERTGEFPDPRNRFVAILFSKLANKTSGLRCYGIVEFGKSVRLKRAYSGSRLVESWPQFELDWLADFYDDIQWLETRPDRSIRSRRDFVPN